MRSRDHDKYDLAKELLECADDYLHSFLARKAVDTGPLSAMRKVLHPIRPIMADSAGAQLLGVSQK